MQIVDKMHRSTKLQLQPLDMIVFMMVAILLNNNLFDESFVAVGVSAQEKSEIMVEPDDYISDENWAYSTHLNEKNFDTFIQQNIDSNKTIFVRWTAGLHCGSCAQQAQGWDDAIRLFATNQKIVFGDVNIKEAGITKLKLPPHQPGTSGGWPTIRYFSKQTGLDGVDYKQKTQMRKWQELGPDHMFMIEFIEDVSNTPLCDVVTFRNCDERSLAFLNKINNVRHSAPDIQLLLEQIQNEENDLRKRSSLGKRDLHLVQQKYLLLKLIENLVFHKNTS